MQWFHAFTIDKVRQLGCVSCVSNLYKSGVQSGLPHKFRVIWGLPMAMVLIQLPRNLVLASKPVQRLDVGGPLKTARGVLELSKIVYTPCGHTPAPHTMTQNVEMVVSLNKGDPKQIPKYYNPRYTDPPKKVSFRLQDCM